MPTIKKKLPPNPSRLIEGLRDTGYDFNTALADIVDNSVDAGADLVDIRIQMDTDGDILVTVADNGCGMDEQTLLDGMTYGAQGSGDPQRLGKFGLGLKTASTAFCRRLAVVTRSSGKADPLKATWDLDHVVKVSEWELLMEEPKKAEIDLLNKAANNHSGTLVIWDKVDRVLKAYANPGGSAARNAIERVADSFRQHAGMIYQRFLDPKDKRARTITMNLNGIPIEAWNPFCEDEEETEMVASEKVPVESESGKKTHFTIRAFILPRKEQFTSEEAHARARLSNSMQGIYIYRENRLIHPADWIGMFSKEPHLTLLRVEFSFDHKLDDAFQVDIKKSRILLNEALYDYVLNQFLPAPRNAANERYRKGQRKKGDEQAKNAHADSDRNIQAKEEDLRMADIQVRDPKKNEVEVTNRSGHFVLKLKVGAASNNGQMNVQTVSSIDDGLLWEPALASGHHAVRINTGHPYYHKVYIPNHSSGVTVQGMDSLLWALVEAELGTISEATLNHFHDLRFEVSRLLRKLVEDLPEPDLDGNGQEDDQA
ncbi:MAG: ATP-binding protein [Planctomycetaceae bacterium]|nr:ATP-binding protein [Planctomycetaceae bacterium]